MTKKPKTKLPKFVMSRALSAVIRNQQICRFKGDFLKDLAPYGTIWTLEQESGMFLSCPVFYDFFFELNSNNLQRVMNPNHSFSNFSCMFLNPNIFFQLEFKLF